MKNTFDILIIGGGASGIIAAIAAKTENPGLKIAILEKLPRVGKKILVTGNGRCNLSNSGCNVDRYHGENPKFTMSAFSNFSVEKTLDLFASFGIMTREEDGGKIYPLGGQASAVLDLLRLKLQKLDIPEITDFEAAEIKPSKNGFGVKAKSGGSMHGRSIIVCTGGSASPQCGTDGSAFKLFEKLGHTKTAIYPALTRLKSSSPWHKSLQGIKFDGKATLMSAGKALRTEEGEILFTDYGLSGPPILQLSGHAVKSLNHNRKTFVVLDLMPKKSSDELKKIIKSLIDSNPDMPLEFFFSGIFNKQIGKILVKAANFGKLSRSSGSLTNEDVSRLVDIIKNWEFEITGYTGWRDAQVTAGGILTSEFFPATMESKILPGLYAAGEVLDIYGDCGGFNLQWAWSSGYVAGKAAAERLKNE
ncbi:MAG: NAD(P)/FAD-dependent oxidoreductase [Clostridia bacterium]|nr:NAD(P)/FAD-dependent oxidoreductase [Clostridia bacterium]